MRFGRGSKTITFSLFICLVIKMRTCTISIPISRVLHTRHYRINSETNQQQTLVSTTITAVIRKRTVHITLHNILVYTFMVITLQTKFAVHVNTKLTRKYTFVTHKSHQEYHRQCFQKRTEQNIGRLLVLNENIKILHGYKQKYLKQEMFLKSFQNTFCCIRLFVLYIFLCATV